MKSVLLKISIFLFLALTLLPGCAQLPPLQPINATKFVLENDEKRYWEQSEQYEKDIEKRNLFFNDSELDSFLVDVARKLQPPQIFTIVPFKIRVIKNPVANAAAFPNGLILLHTGMLSRLENESQLAMLLSHEMTHSTNRHLVNKMRKTRNADFMVVSNIVYSGYSKEAETEADMVGFRLMAGAGYDPQEGISMFELLKEDEAKRGYNAFYFKTHPDLENRIKNLKEMLSQYSITKKGSDNSVFLKKINRAVLENGELHLEAAQLAEAEKNAQKSLKIGSENARTYTLLGKIHKKKGNNESLRKAQEFFDKAVAADAAYPEAYREKGLLHMKNGEKDKAGAALKKYLTLSVNPTDRKLIEEYIKQCPKGVD